VYSYPFGLANVAFDIGRAERKADPCIPDPVIKERQVRLISQIRRLFKRDSLVIDPFLKLA